MADEEQGDVRPMPDDFYNYLPWACNQLQLDFAIIITKVFQNEYVSLVAADKSKKGRAKQTQSRYDVTSDQDNEEKSPSGLPNLGLSDIKVIKITLVYDSLDSLVEIKFQKNRQIPRALLKIIAMIMQFQPYVARITIDSGMDMFTMYEINKFINSSNITEVCLDNSFLKEANYDIILESTNSIRLLSLSKCKINDKVLENIANKLIFPLPASRTLSILNLSSNRVTDEGIKHLAVVLRSNRQLSYISLADNRLTDDGVSLILDTLMEFPITCEELIAARHRYMNFLKEKNLLINSIIKELRAGDFDKRSLKRKSTKPVVASGKKSKLEKESSMKSLGDAKSIANIDMLFYDKAANIAEDRLGDFNDPFGVGNTNLKDGIIYCKGNNALCYLNIAYNSLSYISLKKLLTVLLFQKLSDRKPRGLVNVLVEGNNLPVSCKELSLIDDILETGLMIHNRRLSTSKKRPMSKSTPRL